jgi:hypothetical protein
MQQAVIRNVVIAESAEWPGSGPEGIGWKMAGTKIRDDVVIAPAFPYIPTIVISDYILKLSCASQVVSLVPFTAPSL